MALPRVERIRPAPGSALAASLFLTGCAAGTTLGSGERAERAQDYDLAVVEYTKAVRANPDDRTPAWRSIARGSVRRRTITSAAAGSPPRNGTRKRWSSSSSRPS